MKYIFLVFFFFFSLQCNAQRLQQQQLFEWESSVASNECKDDANGNPCALIVVELPLDSVEFECDYLVGEPKRTASGYEMWVIPSENKYLRISHSDFYSLKIQLVDSNDEKFKGRECYRTIIFSDEEEVAKSESFVKISTNVKNKCTILIEGEDFVEEYETTDDGILDFKRLALGKYRYVVRADGYDEKEGMFELKNIPIEENVHLEINHIASVSDTSNNLSSMNRVSQSNLNQHELVEHEISRERTSFVKLSANVRRKCTVLIEGEDGFCEKYETGNDGVLEYKKLPIGKYRYIIRAAGYKDGEGVFELKDMPLEKEVRLSYDGNYVPRGSIWDSHTIYYAHPHLSVGRQPARGTSGIYRRTNVKERQSRSSSISRDNMIRREGIQRNNNSGNNRQQYTPQRRITEKNVNRNHSHDNTLRRNNESSQRRKVFRQQVEGKSRSRLQNNTNVLKRNTTNRNN